MRRVKSVPSTSQFLHLVSDLSCRFVVVEPEQIGAEIDFFLLRVAEFFNADRCGLFSFGPGQDRGGVIHHVDRSLDDPPPFSLKPAEEFPWLFGQLSSSLKAVQIRSPDELPAEASVDRESLLRRGIRSLLCMPLSSANAVDNILWLGCRHEKKICPDVLLPRFRLLGETLLGILKRKTLEYAQSESLRFERLIADVSSRFAGAWSDQIDVQIDLALREVLAFTRNDQCGFLTIHPEKKQACLSFLAHVDGVVPARMTSDYAALCPWLYERIVIRAENYSFGRLDDLPPEAAADLRFLEETGYRSGLYIPFLVDGVVRYILAIVSNTREQPWPKRIVERLAVLGGVFVNALGRKSVANALRRNERNLAEAQRIANLGSWEWDIPTDKVWTSSQADRILGTRVGTLTELTALSHPDDHAALQKTIEAGLTEPGEKCFIAHRILRPDGVERFVENHFEVFFSGADEPVRAVGTIQDITLRKKNEQELESLRLQQWHAARVAQTGVFVSSLAHELCQPLAAILSNAQAGLQLLAHEQLGVEGTRDILMDIVADDKRAGHVIESLRRMLRRQNTDRKPLDAAEILNDVLGLLHSEFVKNKVEAKTDLAPACLAIGDPAQLQQVLINLVMNAIDAMQDQQEGQRQLLMRVWGTSGGEIQFSVRDSGAGIARSEFDKLFEAFWTTKPGGIGMGLSICRAIVESHGGRIWAVSNNDRGSTFNFTLPAATT